ncbi:MAG TPA: bifunctional phosphoribosyl-AMP cyclohydrolase/phosphoribosyl-ATP diphosphatase HisIE [Clostridiales bacterium]|nr:bifunctional phosphoribosyl-AMP cyclohydrolase/phosphoribosyl-ATP diphosphatase HisIE [Clostridiales bacterium]
MKFQKVMTIIDGSKLNKEIDIAKSYEYGGSDEVFIYNYSEDEKIREEFYSLAKKTTSLLDIPLSIGCFVKRFEDIKIALYTGAKSLIIKINQIEDFDAIKEGSKRFGKDKLILYIENVSDISKLNSLDVKEYIDTIYIKNTNEMLNEANNKILNQFKIILEINEIDLQENIKKIDEVSGFAIENIQPNAIIDIKKILKSLDYNTNLPKTNIPFEQFKLNKDGLIPVIVQDYITADVLMLAYMNKESYNITIETGVMTYYSRSRSELWIKGETSGHYQYLKEISLDCDNDTMLAKVSQIGVACHTGNPSCFYTNLFKKDSNKANPLKVFTDVYDTILDRKNNPKEGSYTNYLFDKGIDKILKKCGEEATEIVIAAKNPNAEELRYEIADFMYHMMVLMAECNLDWNDITNELADRK